MKLIINDDRLFPEIEIFEAFREFCNELVERLNTPFCFYYHHGKNQLVINERDYDATITEETGNESYKTFYHPNKKTYLAHLKRLEQDEWKRR